MDTEKTTNPAESAAPTGTAPQTEAAPQTGPDKRTFVEEIEVSGGQLVARVKELFEDANAKRVVIRSADGDELMTIPLTLGVVAGGVLTLAAPLLAALGALAALVSRVRLEVIREGDPERTTDSSAGSPEDRPPPTA